ncbi:MAG: DUF4199 domain-containing protein [Ferruginibacter sp.]
MKSLHLFSPTWKGVLIAACMITWLLIAFYALRLPMGGTSLYVSFGLYTVGMVWSLLACKKQQPKATFRTYFQEGFKTFIVVTFFAVAYIYFFYKFNPALIEQFIQANEAAARQNPELTSFEIKTNSEQIRKMYVPGSMFTYLIIHLLLGVLVSSVTAAFIQKK